MWVGGQRRLYPGKELLHISIGSWVGPRAGLDGCENFAPTAIRTTERPPCRQSLFRLSYPGAQQIKK
jgi:hypothetical protein